MAKQQNVKTSQIIEQPKRSIIYPDLTSIVIPCYNEELRLPDLLKSFSTFVHSWASKLEIIFVNDGSQDNTVKVLQDFFNKTNFNNATFKIISLDKNSGKGAAIQKGVLEAQGDFILTMDADGAVKPEALKQWLQTEHSFDNNTIYIGSREHIDSIVDKPYGKRRFAGIMFNWMTQLLTGVDAPDTQCGFKLYPQQIAKSLFSNLHEKGWAHDVEILQKANLNNINIKNMSVKWDDIAGSKLNLVADGVKSVFSTLLISLKTKFNYFFIEPFSSAKDSPYTTDSNELPIFRLLFVLISILALILMPLLSKNFGITGDEIVQKEYGEKVLSYYQTNGQDTTALSFKNLYYYGGMFDYFCAKANTIAKKDVYDVRHFINAFVGALLVIFTGFLARKVTKSWLAACLGLLFMLLSPRVFGDSMNNPKDIPFAAAYMFTVIQLATFASQLPRPSFRTLFWLTVGIAAAINVRVGGLILIGYIGLFSLIKLISDTSLIKQVFGRHFLKLVFSVVAVVVIGFYAGMLYWPYGAQAPTKNPFLALKEMSNFSTGIRMLFEGNHLWSDEIPWYYIPKWIYITSPVFILLGLILFVPNIFIKKNKYNVMLTLVIVAGAFPVVYAIYKHSSLYDGMRHFQFVYPMFVVLAVWGWYSSMNLMNSKVYKLGVTVFLAILMALPLKWMVKNHPYEYTYFNEVFGGIDNAYAKYETDYWMVSMKNLCEYFVNNVPEVKAGKEITLATNCILPIQHYLKDYKNVNVVYTRYTNRNQMKADYLMLYSRFVDKDLLANSAWPPPNVVHKEMADNTILGVLCKRPSQEEFLGFESEKVRDLPNAILHYNNALKDQPKNEVVLQALTNCYFNTNDLPNARKCIDQLKAISPNTTDYLTLDGLYQMRTNNLPAASEFFDKSTKVNYRYYAGYYYKGLILYNNKRFDDAIYELENCIKYAPTFRAAYELMAQVYQQKGDINTAQQYMNYAQQLPAGGGG